MNTPIRTPMETLATRKARAKTIQLLILDVDGVLTDGRVWFGPDGESLKAFHTRDGLGIQRLQAAGIPVAIISGRDCAALRCRLAELDIQHAHLGVKDKKNIFNKLIEKLNVTPEQVAYMGDDLPDLPVMQQVGLSIAVADAVPELLAMADWVTERAGGQGAVREVSDFLLAQINTQAAVS